MKIHEIFNPHLFPFRIFSYDFIFYAYFTYAATSDTVTELMTSRKLVTHRILINTNLLYSGTSLETHEGKI